MLLTEQTPKQFLLRWLAHLSERSVRLHRYLTGVAATAPRLSDKPPPVLPAMLLEVSTLAEHIRKQAIRISSISSITDGDQRLSYSGCLQFVKRFLRLHARLSHLPKDWVRSEIEFFLRSVATAAKGRPIALEDYTVITTPTYNFANLLDQEEGQIDAQDYDDPHVTRDLLGLPAVEQHNTLFWPCLVHELGHSVFRPSHIAEIPELAAFFDDIPAEYRDTLRDDFLEEIFCDLFAAAITGPMYYISFGVFASYWVTSPLVMPSDEHPAPETRLVYLANLLNQSNPELMEKISEQIGATIRTRALLDYQTCSQSINEFHDLVKRRRKPSPSEVIKLASIIANSDIFKAMTTPAYHAELSSIVTLDLSP